MISDNNKKVSIIARRTQGRTQGERENTRTQGDRFLVLTN